MKRSQPNKHLFSLTFRELNGYCFLLRSSFFRTTRPLASSEAVAYYRPAYRRDIKANGYKSVLYKFLAGMSKEQVVDKGIIIII